MICSKCKIDKEKNYFHNNKSSYSGKDYWCKTCISTRRKSIVKINTLTQKVCCSCKENLPATSFHTSKSQGLQARCKKCRAEYQHQRLDKYRKYGRKQDKKIKEKIIEQYGGKCECCEETAFEFLTIDHINKDGAKHRKQIGRSKLYRWLVKNNYPKDNFRLLCMNCNFAQGIYGYCPHKKEKE